MKMIQKTLILSLLVIFSWNSAKGDDLMLPLVTTGGLVVSANPALSAALEAVFWSIIAVGTTSAANDLSSNQEKGFIQAKAVIIKEMVDYQANGNFGLSLELAVNAIKEKNIELSDAEAIDYLIEALNH